MRVSIECMYCGHKWEKMAYNKQSIEDEKCPKCNDSTLKVKDLEASKIDYYQGSPPFPPKEEKGWTYTGIDYGYAPGVD